MPLSSFEMLNEKAKQDGGKIFSNPRNAASGSIRMKDNRVTGERKLQFFAYDIGDWEEFIENPPQSKFLKITEDSLNYYNFIYFLESLGFSISSYFKKCNNIQQIITEIQNF